MNKKANKIQEDDLYKEILDNVADGVYFVDRERRINFWNKGAEGITGFDASHMVGHFCYENRLNHITENGVQLCLNGCPLHAAMQDGMPREAEIYLHHADGYRIPVLVRVLPVRNENGQVVGAVETFNNNTSLMSMRRQVRRLKDSALRDPLTGIGNRRYMEQNLHRAILEFQQNPIPFGVLFLDIDHFKKINDTHGHTIGDRVLVMVANTLGYNFRFEDTVARWGGEEFIALIANVDNRQLKAVAEKLRKLVKYSTLRLEDQNLGVTVSIGSTLFRADDTLESIVHRADQNMYQSKQAGRDRVTGDTRRSQ